ncbi:uncharacterized protein VTP21DRAFT_8477 [Calcarisporiella thermophila]|uniref:uncharacterized protein n=1 Tax=Calcarisporiella thermophila TaxID=911321 RepID=UPI00374220A3
MLILVISLPALAELVKFGDASLSQSSLRIVLSRAMSDENLNFLLYSCRDEDPKIRLKGVTAIQMLARQDSNLDRLAEMRTLDTMVEIVAELETKKYTESTEPTLRAAMAVITFLIDRNDTRKEQIVQQGILESILNILSKYPNNNELRYWSLMVAFLVSQCKPVQPKLIEAGFLPVFARMTLATYGSLVMPKYMMQALVTLISSETQIGVVQKHLRDLLECDIGSIIATCLKSEDYELLWWGLMLLHEYAVRDVNLELFRSIKSILRSMANLLSMEGLAVSRIVLRVLTLLSHKQDDYQIEIIRCGLVKHVVECLTSNEEDIQYWSLWMLRELGKHLQCHEKIFNAGGLAVLLDLTRSSNNNSPDSSNSSKQMISLSVQLISMLCTSHANIKWLSGEPNLLPRLCELLKSEDTEVFKDVAAMVFNLSSMSNEFAIGFIEAGSVKLLSNALLTSKNEDILITCADALLMLAIKDSSLFSQFLYEVIRPFIHQIIELATSITGVNLYNPPETPARLLSSSSKSFDYLVAQLHTLSILFDNHELSSKFMLELCRTDSEIAMKEPSLVHNLIATLLIICAQPALTTSISRASFVRKFNELNRGENEAYFAALETFKDFSESESESEHDLNVAMEYAQLIGSGNNNKTEDTGEELGCLDNVGLLSRFAQQQREQREEDGESRKSGKIKRLLSGHSLHILNSLMRFEEVRDQLKQAHFVRGILRLFKCTRSLVDISVESLAIYTRYEKALSTTDSITVGIAVWRALASHESPLFDFYGQLLLNTLASHYVDEIGWPTSNRPHCVEWSLNRKTSLLCLSYDHLEVRNDAGTFESVCATHGVTGGGKYAYEIVLKTDGMIQVGWATDRCHFDAAGGNGVGDDSESYSYDGERCMKWHGSVHLPKRYGDRWSKGDVITVALDLDAGKISYSRNGAPLGVAFGKVDTRKIWYPAISVASGEGCRARFGDSIDRLKYLPDDYEPIAAVLHMHDPEIASNACTGMPSEPIDHPTSDEGEGEHPRALLDVDIDSPGHAPIEPVEAVESLEAMSGVETVEAGNKGEETATIFDVIYQENKQSSGDAQQLAAFQEPFLYMEAVCGLGGAREER